MPIRLAGVLENDPATIAGYADQALIERPTSARLVLFVDQLEELFMQVAGNRSCPFWRRVIPPPSNPGHMPPDHTTLRGRAPDRAPCLLPVGTGGMPGARQPGACPRAQSRRAVTAATAGTRAAAGDAHTRQRTHTCCGAHAPPPVPRGCTRRAPAHRTASPAARGEAPDQSTPVGPRHRAALWPACRRRLARRAGPGPPPRQRPSPRGPVAPRVRPLWPGRRWGDARDALARPPPGGGVARPGAGRCGCRLGHPGDRAGGRDRAAPGAGRVRRGRSTVARLVAGVRARSPPHAGATRGVRRRAQGAHGGGRPRGRGQPPRLPVRAVGGTALEPPRQGRRVSPGGTHPRALAPGGDSGRAGARPAAPARAERGVDGRDRGAADARGALGAAAPASGPRTTAPPPGDAAAAVARRARGDGVPAPAPRGGHAPRRGWPDGSDPAGAGGRWLAAPDGLGRPAAAGDPAAGSGARATGPHAGPGRRRQTAAAGGVPRLPQGRVAPGALTPAGAGFRARPGPGRSPAVGPRPARAGRGRDRPWVDAARRAAGAGAPGATTACAGRDGHG